MTGRMHGLDLFSGVGGLSLALEPWAKTIAYCEQEPYAQGVLLSRMLSGDIDTAPIWDDVRSLRGDMLPKVDIIFGGFPCQDISVAGNGAGLEGKRSGLFFEICRLIAECEPTFVFLENVPAIRTRGLHTVIEELSRLGYECRWTCLSAQEVGAPHLRKRWFLLAGRTDSNRNGREGVEELDRQEPQSEGQLGNDVDGLCDALSDTVRDELRNEQGRSGGASREGQAPPRDTCSTGGWQVEPGVGRVVDELPNRMDRLRCLGNAVVPLQAQIAFKELIGLK